jgi:hypothetical protein
MYQLPDTLIREVILACESDANLFPSGWVVRLYVNNLAPTKATPLASFTELTNVEVPGYAPVAGVWQGNPVRSNLGVWEDYGVGPLQFYASSAPPSPQIVYGWFATNAAGSVLLGAGQFSVPFTFTLSGDGFNLDQLAQMTQLAGNAYQLLLDMQQE